MSPDSYQSIKLLAEASSALLDQREPEVVVPRILALSEQLIKADAYALWRLDPEGREWRVVAESNLSAGYDRVAPHPGAAAPVEPLFLADVFADAPSESRRNAWEAEGIRSLLSVPLKVQGEMAGGIVFYYRTPRERNETDIELGSALANLAGAALTNAELFAEQGRQRRLLETAQLRLQYLAEASAVLASSLDYQETLEHIARLAVPHLADWCLVHEAEEDGAVRQVALAHVNPDKVRWARTLQERYPYDPTAPRGIPNVMRTGEAELYPQITDEMLQITARDPEHLEILRQVGFTACIIAPLRLRSRTLGAISFVWAESGKTYDHADLLLAEDLAARAAAAIENARLYRNAQAAVQEAQQAEAARRISQERLELAQRVTRIGTFDWDISAQQVSWTPELEALYGLETGCFNGGFADWVKLILPEDRETTVAVVREAISKGNELDTRFRILTPAGDVRWISVRSRTFYGEAGEPQRMLGINMDVTDQVRVEEALEHQAAALLEQDRRRSEFLAMLAHELRNPLSPIVTATEVLRIQGDQPHQGRRHESISRNARHLARIVDDLLDVSRISQGKVSLNRERIDLRAVVEQAVAAVQPFAEQRGHDLSVSVPLEPLYLLADPTRLVQVLTNLLHNAAKYTEPGGAISLLAARERDVAVISVRDNGRGISDALLPHVFELFVQGEQSLARTEGGLGIGLTLVQRLIEMHGGSITASSPGPGQGSEFQVRLKAERSAPAPRKRRPAPAPRPLPMRILIVDDNVDAAESLAELLDLWDHEVRVVHDGPMALEVVPEFEPELVLLDLGLPGMDGFEVARRMRAQFGPKPAIAALTGYGDDTARQRAAEAGFDDFLTKPVDPDGLRTFLGSKAPASR